MRVYIAEKPSVGMDIAKAIGGSIKRHDGYLEVGSGGQTCCISWAFGHLVETAKPDEYDPIYKKWELDVLPFFPEKLIIRPRAEKDKFGKDILTSDGKVKLDAGILKQINTIGKLLKSASEVVVAGDAAREGQLIVDELLEFHGYKGKAVRLWLQEMNAEAIRKALGRMKPNSEYENLYKAALGRQSLDFLIGMNCTRGYTVACRNKGHDMVLHIGRVQTPTICLVVARDLEIENFIPKDFYMLRVDFKHANGDFKAKWVPKEDSTYLDEAKQITNKSVVEAIGAKITGKQGLIAEYDTVAKRESPPLPFSLGDLQKEAFKQMGLSASETLAVAQSLYEKHKLLSYPRTDYSYLPVGDHAHAKEFLDAAKSNLGKEWDFPGEPDFSLKSRAWDDSKIGDHFAIRPTNRGGYDLGLLSPKEQRIYKLVVKQFLAQFYPVYAYDATTVWVDCEGEKFKANGKLDKDLGWKVLFERAGAIKVLKEEEQLVPNMFAGDACKVQGWKAESKKTKAKERFDPATLIGAMERVDLFVTDEKVKKTLKDVAGIGTPATRSNIIDHMLTREYIQEITEGKKKFYMSTDRARFLYKIVPDWLRKPDLTAYFEDLLKQVEHGELEYEKLISRQRLFVEKQINAVKDGTVEAMMPAKGTYSAPTRAGKKGTRVKKVGEVGSKQKPKAKSVGKCPKCSADLMERKGSNGVFVGCSAYPVCKHTQEAKKV